MVPAWSHKPNYVSSILTPDPKYIIIWKRIKKNMKSVQLSMLKGRELFPVLRDLDPLPLGDFSLKRRPRYKSYWL